jgi:S1-C subfamily serine protease
VRHFLALSLCVAALGPIFPVYSASADFKATYVGGTVSSFKPGLHGRLNLQDGKELLFRCSKSQSVRITYLGITELALGQAAGHIPASRVAMGAALGLPGVLLMRKKSKNYLTISYVNSAGSNEVAVLDLSKEDTWIAIPILEARSGRKVIRDGSSGAKADSAPRLDVIPPQLASTGTAFAISTDGFFLTNDHVIKGCANVLLRGVGNSSQEARVWADDPTNDLALLKTPDMAGPTLKFAENSQLRLGQNVVVIGYPMPDILAHGAKVTIGNISSLAGMNDDTRVVQVTAPIQPGNSGGPVLDEGGNVIGVVQSTLGTVATAAETGKIPQNMNFAIKASIARVFLDSNNILYGTTVTDRRIGVSQISETAEHSVLLVECWK